MDHIAIAWAEISGEVRILRAAVRGWSAHGGGPGAAGLKRTAHAVCAQAKRRPARGDRMGRPGPKRGDDSRFAAFGATRACWHCRAKLWRGRSNRNSRSAVSLAAAHQRYEFSMAARLSRAPADHADCLGNVAGVRGSAIYRLPLGRAQHELAWRQE